MPNFKEMYFKLFAATADAVDALEAGQPFKARQILIEAQLQGEESYISDDETELLVIPFRQQG